MGELVVLEKEVIDNAKFSASKIADKLLRKRAYALNIAANATARYLNENGLKIQTNRSLYKSAAFARELEFADIYFGNARFDVRVTFNNTSFCIPKTHTKYDVKPLAYIVVKFDSSLKDIEFLGFIEESELVYEKTETEYYNFSIAILKPISEFANYANTIEQSKISVDAEVHTHVKELCLAFLDNQATEADKIYFIQHVVKCPYCRETFCDMNDFDDILSQLKNYDELLNDSTLSVLSGNKEELSQATLASLALVENAQEDDNTVLNQEEFLSLESDLVEIDEDNSQSDVSENEIINNESDDLNGTLEQVDEVVETINFESDDILDFNEPVSLDEVQEEPVVIEEKIDEQDTVELEEVLATDEIQEELAVTDELVEADDIVELEDVTSPVEELETTIIDETIDVEDMVELEEIVLSDEVQEELAVNEESIETDDVVELGEVDLLEEVQENEELSEESIETEDLPALDSEFVDDIPVNAEEALIEDIDVISLESVDDKVLEEPKSDEILLQVDEESFENLEETSEDTLEPEVVAEVVEDALSFDEVEILEEELQENSEDIFETEDLVELNEDAVTVQDFDNEELLDDANIELENLDEVEDLDIDTSTSEDSILEDDTDDVLLESPDELVFAEEPENLQEVDEDLEGIDGAISLDEDVAFEQLEEDNSLVEQVEAVAPEKEDIIYAQEPVELKYDDEVDINEDFADDEIGNSSVVDSNEDVVNDNQELDVSVYEQSLEDSVVAQEEVEITNVQNDDVQSLLDEDLLALLSDDDNDVSVDVEEDSFNENLDSEMVDSTNDNVIASDAVEDLYDGQEIHVGESVEFDISQEPVSAETIQKTKKIAVSAALIALLAIGGGIGAWYLQQKNNADNTMNAASGDEMFGLQDYMENSNPMQSAAVPQDINKSMTNSFSDKPTAISITKLSWQISEKLAIEPSVKEYLQTAGKNIQLNLQDALANSVDIAFNNSVKVTFEITPDNVLKSLQITESSGSDMVDNIITKSLSDTLKYVRVPKLDNYKANYLLTLIINF